MLQAPPSTSPRLQDVIVFHHTSSLATYAHLSVETLASFYGRRYEVLLDKKIATSSLLHVKAEPAKWKNTALLVLSVALLPLTLIALFAKRALRHAYRSHLAIQPQEARATPSVELSLGRKSPTQRLSTEFDASSIIDLGKITTPSDESADETGAGKTARSGNRDEFESGTNDIAQIGSKTSSHPNPLSVATTYTGRKDLPLGALQSDDDTLELDGNLDRNEGIDSDDQVEVSQYHPQELGASPAMLVDSGSRTGLEASLADPTHGGSPIGVATDEATTNDDHQAAFSSQERPRRLETGYESDVDMNAQAHPFFVFSSNSQASAARATALSAPDVPWKENPQGPHLTTLFVLNPPAVAELATSRALLAEPTQGSRSKRALDENEGKRPDLVVDTTPASLSTSVLKRVKSAPSTQVVRRPRQIAISPSLIQWLFQNQAYLPTIIQANLNGRAFSLSRDQIVLALRFLANLNPDRPIYFPEELSFATRLSSGSRHLRRNQVTGLLDPSSALTRQPFPLPINPLPSKL